jgi:hypothetical protein
VVVAANTDGCANYADNPGSVGVYSRRRVTATAARFVPPSLRPSVSWLPASDARWTSRRWPQVARCSEVGFPLADLLSKAQIQRFWALAWSSSWPLARDPGRLLVQLVQWIHRPCMNHNLSLRKTKELTASRKRPRYSLSLVQPACWTTDLARLPVFPYIACPGSFGLVAHRSGGTLGAIM